MTDETSINLSENSLLGFSPLGEVFASARNAKKLALKDVSNHLRLSIKQIEALESNDFANLPQAMITRGFIRNYARLLELDAEPLLSSYRARMPEPLPSTLSVKTSMNQVMPTKGDSSVLKYMLFAGFVLTSIAAWFYYNNYIKKSELFSSNTVVAPTATATSVDAALPEVALPAAERMPQPDAVNAEGSDNAATEGMKSEEQSQSSNASVSKVEPATQHIENSLAESNTAVTTQNLQLPKESAVDFNTLKEKAAQKAQSAIAISVNPNAQIKAIEPTSSGLKADSSIAAIKPVNIAVSEQTWVRVTDKTGSVVYEKMLQANSEDGFNGLPPFKMLIGNAKATKVTFLGQYVDITSKTRNNVARVTLE